MSKLYWIFIDWMGSLSMEGVFIFTGISVITLSIAIGIPISIYILKAQEKEKLEN